MKLTKLDLEGKSLGQIEMPEQFTEEVREDLIKKACEVVAANKMHTYGAMPQAGQRQCAKLSRRRRNYKTSYGIGISRSPRKIMSRKGTRFNWMGAVAPYTRGGRRAHPPKAEKILSLKISKDEKRKAIRSALSATLKKESVIARGHRVPKDYPFIISTDFEKQDKTKVVNAILLKLGLEEELTRSATKKVRAGKGTMRGRRYKKRVGPLLVVSENCKLSKSAANIPGVDIKVVNELNASDLAPGAKPGRLTIFTENAIKKIKEGKLFI